MSSPISPMHDVNFNVNLNNSCNDCCENDRCTCSCCCLPKRTPKPSPSNAEVAQAQEVSKVAVDLGLGEEKREEFVEPPKIGKPKYKSCVIMEGKWK